MTLIETPTRAEVISERKALLDNLSARHSTEDRGELRELSLSGQMSMRDVSGVERLLALDFLLGSE